MMYLSRIRLNISKRITMQALTMPNKFHGAVESSFEGERQRNLWRIDHLRGDYYLLIQSGTKPRLDSAIEQFGFPEDEESAQIKEYDQLLKRVSRDSLWHFRLVANPTRSVKQGEVSSRGKVCAHVTTEYQKKWLLDRADKLGILLDENGFDVIEKRWYNFRKGKDTAKRISLLAVTYEGVLTVQDEELFRKVLKEGIGREKAYGMGLMTIMQVSKGD